MYGNFGFIHEKLEIKILILFILRRLSEPVNFDVLTELTMCDDGISYFDFTECVAELVETGHLRLEDCLYSLTEKGAYNGGITENSLPFSVRTRAESAVSLFRTKKSRDAMISTFHTANPEGGFTVSLSLADGIGKIMSMEMAAMTERQALSLERGFRDNAESVYNAIIEKMFK